MSGRVLFVATELDPVVPGGAGTVVAGLASLLADAGTAVTVVLMADAAAPATPPGVEVVVVPPEPPDDDVPSAFLSVSRTAAEAVSRLVEGGKIERIEFQDFHGLAFWTLTHRSELGLGSVPIAIRVHAPVDLILDAVGVSADSVERHMEREAFAMADAVIAQTATGAQQLAGRYRLDPQRVIEGEPPVPALAPVPLRPAVRPEFVCLGRLGVEKGSDLFLDAALRLLHEGVDVRFRFVGPEGWRIPGGASMREWLAAQVPEEHADRVTFEGPVPRAELGTALATAWAVVIPSRIESFCLAAHEARALRHAVIVSDLPAYQDYLGPETGAMVYDGTAAGLADAMQELATAPSRRDRLAAAPRPTYGDPLAPYRGEWPAPRHWRAQAGLATAAWQRTMALVRVPRRPSPFTRLAQAALRVLPDGAGRALIRIVPTRLKDRFRGLASWPEELARRRQQEERQQLDEAIAAGGFSEERRPIVSVVIACFNQGEFLGDAIRSVFAQGGSFEIIVVDDGSTDPETIRVLDSLSYPRCRVIRQANTGLPGARNAGMRAARGEFLVPLDADDELGPGFMTKMTAALAAHPEAAFAHCWSELFGDQAAVWVPRPYNPYTILLSNSLVGCVLMRREAWEAVGGYDESMTAGNEDWDLWLRFLEAGYGEVEVDEPLFRYRRHGVSMSVETEARFESARKEMMAAHPALFESRALRQRKSEWYPFVSVVVGEAAAVPPGLAAQTLDDLEVVTRGPAGPDLLEMCEQRGWPVREAEPLPDAAVRAARGKFLIRWPGEAPPEMLQQLAERLEEADAAYAAAFVVPAPVGVLWRRWSLLDPGADPDRVELVPQAGGEPPPIADERGRYPDRRWSPDPGAYELPLLRPRPEEEGRFPSWAG